MAGHQFPDLGEPVVFDLIKEFFIELPQGFPQHGFGYLELFTQLFFRGQFIPGFELSVINRGLDNSLTLSGILVAPSSGIINSVVMAKIP